MANLGASMVLLPPYTYLQILWTTLGWALCSLQWSFYPQPMLPTVRRQPRGLIMASHMVIQKVPIRWTWEHICGHQDKTVQPLAQLEKWNDVAMDKATNIIGRMVTCTIRHRYKSTRIIGILWLQTGKSIPTCMTDSSMTSWELQP